MPDNQIQNNEQKEDQLLYEKYLKTTSKQAGMVFGTRVIGYLLGFAMQAVFARFLGADKYGLYTLGLTVANVGVLFGTFGLNAGMTRFLGEYIGKKQYPKAKATIIFGIKWCFIFSTTIAVLVFIFRKQIAIGIFGEERLVSLLPLFSLLLIFLSLENLLNGITKGFQKPSIFYFYKEIIERALRLGIFVVFFLFGVETIGAVFATLFASFFVFLRLIIWLHGETNKTFGKEDQATYDSKSLITYSSYMLFVSFTFFLMGQINRLIIGFFLDSEEVGLYSLSDSLAHLSVFFSAAFLAIFAPIISEVFHKNKMYMLANLYSNITRWITTLTIPILIWFAIFSEKILFIFGSEYIIAKWTLIMLTIGQFFNAATGTSQQMLTMTKYQRLGMINGVIIACLNIGLNFFLIPKFGIIGSAIAGAFSIATVNVIQLIEVFFLLKIFPYNKSFLKLIIPSLITYISMYFLNYYLGFFGNLIIVIFGFIGTFIIYFLLLLSMKLAPEDKLILKTIVKKLKT